MITLKLDKAKSRFFDRDWVIGAMDKATHAALSRGGAIVMREARKSIKNGSVMARGRVKGGERRRVKGVRVSLPGNPPFSQTGLLRSNIFFIATRGTLSGSSVQVGPILISHATGAPDNLEFGATVSRAAGTMRVKSGRNSKGHFQSDRNVPVPARTVRVAARPFMRPALEKLVASGKLPDMWRNALVPGGGP